MLENANSKLNQECHSNLFQWFRWIYRLTKVYGSHMSKLLISSFGVVIRHFMLPQYQCGGIRGRGIGKFSQFGSLCVYCIIVSGIQSSVVAVVAATIGARLVLNLLGCITLYVSLFASIAHSYWCYLSTIRFYLIGNTKQWWLVLVVVASELWIC